MAADLRARAAGRIPSPAEAGYPRIDASAPGVRFIQRKVASAADERKWTPVG